MFAKCSTYVGNQMVLTLDIFFFRPLHQRGPPIIRNKNPYPEFHGKEAEIYQPQTRYEELPRLAPPREEFRDTGTYFVTKIVLTHCKKKLF